MKFAVLALLCLVVSLSEAFKFSSQRGLLHRMTNPLWNLKANEKLSLEHSSGTKPVMAKKIVNGIPVETENGPAIISMESLLPFLRQIQPNLDINTVDQTSPEWNNLLLKYLLAMKKSGYEIREMNQNLGVENASRVRFLRVY